MLLRLVGAFFVAPLIGMAAGDMVCALFFQWGFGLLLFVGAFYVYPVVFVLGLPIYIALSRLGRLSLWSILASSLLLGATAWSIASWPLSGPAFDSHAVPHGVFAFVSSVIGALVFWSHIADLKGRTIDSTQP